MAFLFLGLLSLRGNGFACPVITPFCHSFLTLFWNFFFFNVLHYYIQCFCIVCNNDFYYPTVFIIVQKARETSKISHDIVQLVIVQYRARAHPVTLVVFFQFP